MLVITHIYKAAGTYQHAVDLLEKLVRAFDPAAPDMVRSDIVQVLGEELGIWPEDCFADAMRGKETLVA